MNKLCYTETMIWNDVHLTDVQFGARPQTVCLSLTVVGTWFPPDPGVRKSQTPLMPKNLQQPEQLRALYKWIIQKLKVQSEKKPGPVLFRKVRPTNYIYPKVEILYLADFPFTNTATLHSSTLHSLKSLAVFSNDLDPFIQMEFHTDFPPAPSLAGFRTYCFHSRRLKTFSSFLATPY
jgi:hypothetical protein